MSPSHKDTAAFVATGPSLARRELMLIAALTTNSEVRIRHHLSHRNLLRQVLRPFASQRTSHASTSSAHSWAITSALVKRLTALTDEPTARVEIVQSARVVQLVEECAAAVSVVYELGHGRSLVEARARYENVGLAATQPPA
ncbi:hypothetical protein MSAN_00776400 [Mycena sanguinolenta]|uniref:Uncharacterized protein n=1 Tax=Mycena sanguinolenta TaxID=230812 RepID=A0A8H7DGI4_9AGAR|nr:hypothetical protein MSAN_00776400 [Mycena sanguinolenta]